ncbi:sensor histidine kinase [Tenacibaculum sp. 190524A05c]|uniref:sensor histidine kinase n=1 Tax=Tenacibaculum platacis TaxID=3137852 RepID=UPI0032B13E14
MKLKLKKYLYNQDENLSGLESKRITILNFCCFLMTFDILFFTIKRAIENELNSQILFSYVTYLMLFITVYFLQQKKYYVQARILFLMSFAFAVFMLTQVLFIHENTEYNYLGLPILALFFFDRKWVHYVTLLIAMFLFFIPYYITENRNLDNFIPAEKVFLFIILFLVVKFFKDVNESNEKKLKNAYEELEENKQNELSSLRFKLLKSQLNPHFMFNSINSIQNLVLKGNKHEAYDYLTKFSSFLRENLNTSEKRFITLKEETLVLEQYLELEKLRFKENFEYKLNTFKNMEYINIPTMIIQPYVENAIKHGLLHKKEGLRKLEINFKIKDENLKCEIIDNGIGVIKSKEINKLNNLKKEQFVNEIIQERIAFLRDYYTKDVIVEYPEVDSGTAVILSIPYSILNEEENVTKTF